jgi:HD-GYP domain-containing protein (c-di-GMP phosphodiesterase class II)
MQTLAALVKELAVGIMNTLLYFPGHARVQQSITQVRAYLEQLAAEGIAFPLTVGVAEDKIIHEGKPLLGASFYAKKLTTAIRERGTGGLRFEADVTDREIAFVLELLGRRSDPDGNDETLNQLLDRNHVEGIRFVPPFEESTPEGRADLWNSLDDLRMIKVPAGVYQNMVDLLQTSAIRAARSIDIEMDRVYDLAVEVLKILSDQPEMLLAIAENEDSDDHNLRHSIRVCLRTCLAMQGLVDDRELLLRTCCAGLLHDIGKAMVPEEILGKPGALNAEELAEIRQHPVHGARILLAQDDPDPLVVRVAYAHHINSDRSGYPEVAPDFELDPITQLLQICDVFEALCAKRPYKRAFTPGEAFRIMLAERKRYHPGLLSFFIRTTGLFPLGSVLQLANGEVGQVVRGGKDFYSPRVRLLRTADGVHPPQDERPEIDLERTGADESRRVEAILHAPNLVEGLLV